MNWDSTSNNEIPIGIDGTTSDYIYFTGTGDDIILKGSVEYQWNNVGLDDTDWHNYCFVAYADRNIELYIDGVSQGNDTDSSSDFSLDTIGDGYSGSYELTGLIVFSVSLVIYFKTDWRNKKCGKYL